MSWYQYESAREKKQRMERELKKRIARGETLQPLVLAEGKRKIAHTFWGNAWCQHIESYRDYENRLPRARTYLRQGTVYNLSVEPGKIRAQVAGSTLYDVEITIHPMSAEAWEGVKQACAGQIGSLLDLLSGQLGSGVMAVIADKERGLFPGPREIRFNCNCPDYADLCKHSGAVLYGVAVKFDADPSVFFRLRGVDPTDLLASGAEQALAPAAETALGEEDLSALFGIDLGQGPEEAEAPLEPTPAMAMATAKPKRKTPVRRAVKEKAAAKKPARKSAPKRSPAAPRGGASAPL